MGNKQTAQSRDQSKLNAFYQPNMTNNKIIKIETQAKQHKFKYFYRAFIVGFIFQYCLGVSRIYDQLNKKTANRRLIAKRKQDMMLEQKHGQKGKVISQPIL